MTERQGAFTVSTQLFLSAERRARLERLVLDQRVELADIVSSVVADHVDTLASAGGADRDGTVAIPTRLYLTPAARERIEQLTHERGVELADLISEVVAAYVDTLPPPPPQPAPDHSRELRQRRTELARLRARREAAGPNAPAWLNAYIAEIEAEVHRLES
jgi:hypothetical protein